MNNNLIDNDIDIEYTSQLNQDKWVIKNLNYKNNGFFLDIGASDGITHSNSYVLEKYFDWKGICVEPDPYSYKMLNNNRDCICDNSLLDETEANVHTFHSAQGLSFINNPNNPTDLDKLKKYANDKGFFYDQIRMKTDTISSVLEKYNAPFVIDYLSIDIEGMEYSVLKSFPFDDYHVNLITVEHNAPHIGQKYRLKIRKLLENNSFEFIKGNDDIHGWGHGSIDDFYKNKNLLKTDPNHGTTVTVVQYILDE